MINDTCHKRREGNIKGNFKKALARIRIPQNNTAKIFSKAFRRVTVGEAKIISYLKERNSKKIFWCKIRGQLKRDCFKLNQDQGKKFGGFGADSYSGSGAKNNDVRPIRGGEGRGRVGARPARGGCQRWG